MNKLRFAYPLALAAGTVLLSGCALSKMIKMAKDQKLAVTPSPLELHGDSVRFEMAVNLPVGMLKPNKIYAVNTFYTYTDQKETLGEVRFKASDFPKAKTQEPRVSKTFGFYYKGEAMNKGELKVQGIASNLNGVQKATPEIALPDGMGRGLITTSRLVQDLYLPSYAPHGYVAGEEIGPISVEFFFEQNKSILRPSESKSLRGKFLDNFIAAKNETKTVIITGRHSPEGTEVRNTTLAEERSKVVESFYRSLMKKYKQDANTIQFVPRSQVQNWNAFLDSVDVYPSLTADQKKQVADIVGDGKGNFSEIEAKIAGLPFYQDIYTNIYPKLRTAETEILIKLPKKTDAEISLLAQKIVRKTAKSNALTDRELAYAATLTPDLEEKEGIYRAATKKNDSWASHNNLAAVYLQMAIQRTGGTRKQYAERAITSLKISLNKQASAEANTNLAVAYLLLDNPTEASNYLKAARQLKPEAEARKVVNSLASIPLIKAGKYEEAITLLNDAVEHPTVLFNKGLAELCSRNYQVAAGSLSKSIQLDNKQALAFYAQAVVAARMNNVQTLTETLSRAVSLDASLRSKALNDLEFVKYWDNAQFKGALVK